jgi:hypothetical protein
MVDLIQLYLDNDIVINLLLGALLVYVAQIGKNVLVKNKIRDARVLLDTLDASLEDDKITIEEQRLIIVCIKDLIGIDILTKIKGLIKL